MARFTELPETLGLPNEELVETEAFVPMLCSRVRPDAMLKVWLGYSDKIIRLEMVKCRPSATNENVIRSSYLDQRHGIVQAEDWLQAVCVAKHMISELTQEGNPTHGVNNERPHTPEL